MGIADKILGQQDRDGMLRRSLERIIQLYTDKSHFVYELLQNAEDTGADSIKFIQYPDRLEVLHNGHGFTTENLQGICDIGQSDKINNLNQIGEFGVGFKSVFGICEKVKIYSMPDPEDLAANCTPFGIEIVDFTHPVDIDFVEVDDGYTTKFIFPYAVGYNFSGFKTIDAVNKAISARLKNLGVTTLLFMKNLQSIEYEINVPGMEELGSYLLDKKKISDRCSYVSALESNNDVDSDDSSYLIFTAPIDKLNSTRTVDIAYPAKRNKAGDYSFSKPRSPYISVYFPTETESKLNFIVQGPFRTTPNRSSVPADDSENVKLVKLLTDLYKISILEMRDLGILNLSFLNLLPVEDEVFSSYGLFRPFYDVTSDIIENEKVLPCKEGGYCSAENALIARGADLPEVFSDKLISSLIQDSNDYHWLPTSITETGPYRKVHRYLTFYLDVIDLRPEGLRDYFNKNTGFLPRRDDEWLCRLYKMYEAIPNVFSETNPRNILNAVIVKTNDGSFVAPYRKVERSYIANVFLPSSKVKSNEICTVNPGVYDKCKTFFKNVLHLDVPNEYEFFIKDLKKRYDGDEKISDEQHCDDVRKMARYSREADYSTEVRHIMQNDMWLYCKANGKRANVKPCRYDIYFPKSRNDLQLDGYFKNISDKIAFVDYDYYAANGVTFDELAEFEISDDITLYAENVSGEYNVGARGRQPTWSTYGDFRYKFTIRELEKVLAYISEHPKAKDSILKSQTIFKILKLNESKLSGTLYISGNYDNKENQYASVIQTLLKEKVSYLSGISNWDGKWLYTESLELVAPKDISKHDLSQAIYGPVDISSGLYEMLQFKKSKIDKQEGIVKEYDSLPEEKRNSFFELELERRFGLSVDDLNAQYGGGSRKPVEPKNPVVEDYEFPSSSVKNWDALRKHAAQVLCYASPVKYSYVVRSIRTSRPQDDVRAYLMNTYRVDGTYKYACQLCHNAVSKVEVCQIEKKPDVELDPMNVCLCNNCAALFRQMRNSDYIADRLIENITDLTESDILDNDPVEIEFEDKKLWFTQTHIAEVRELLSMKSKAESKEKPSNVTTPVTDDNDGEEETSDVNIFKELIGKRIFHTKKRKYGEVKDCTDAYIIIRLDGENTDSQFSLKICMENEMIKLAEDINNE